MASKLSVMLIDDNEIDNFVNHKVIELTNCSSEISIYNAAETALEFLNLNAQHLSNIPDLIFLDLNMPILDGFAFLSEFDKLPAQVRIKTKIIVLSSSGRSLDMEKAYSNKYVIDYIAKPLTSDILLKSLKKRDAITPLSL